MDSAARQTGTQAIRDGSAVRVETTVHCLSCGRTPTECAVPIGAKLPTRCPRCQGNWWVSFGGDTEVF
jgi:hypothetical protein